MVFSVTYSVCEAPQLDALRSQSVTPTSCQYDSIRSTAMFVHSTILVVQVTSSTHISNSQHGGKVLTFEPHDIIRICLILLKSGLYYFM